MKVLFVCVGNSERSVIAESLYNKITNSNNAFSAGIRAKTTERSKRMINLMQDLGVDIEDKPKTKLRKKMLNAFDEIFVLASKDNCPLYLLESKKVSFWTVPDPSGKEYTFLLRTKKLIEENLMTIL